jgi:uncharacterized protein YcnI
MSRSAARRCAVTLGAGLAALVLSAVPAAAHVTVNSPDATPGGFGKLVVRVPTESDTAATTKVAVTLPADTPFAFVSTKPHPGWTVATTERTLGTPIKAEGFTLTKAVSTVTWTAASAADGIGPGQFDEFELSLGPFPSHVDALSFPTTQTYSDGSVVQWDQATAAGKAEPEHPAPTLQLTAATGAGTEQTDTKAAADDGTSSDTAAVWLAGAALVVAPGALVLAALVATGLVGRPRTTA